ncbi:methionine synthase [candidate division KSB1 bacterium]|nr:methionine synthase [candidate division KSB1 bacterium]
MKKISIKTTTVGSYPLPTWLTVHPTEEALIDATRVVFAIQQQAGIDLPTDGELYRFDINHPDTNGMIEYFTRSFAGIRSDVGQKEYVKFNKMHRWQFRRKPAGVVVDKIEEGSLNLLADCERAAKIATTPFKFTLTSPYMLARTLLDEHYSNFENMLMDIAGAMAAQVSDLPCACVQIDEANIPGKPEDAPLAARAINNILENIKAESAVHLCFGNYGGQTIQKGTWNQLIEFVNQLQCNHLILEVARRPENEIQVLKEIRPEIDLGIGVIDIKINHIETPDEIARKLEKISAIVAPNRIKWIHPDCGFWMLKRSVADRKMHALAQGRDRFLGIK